MAGSRKDHSEQFKAEAIKKWKDSQYSMAEIEREMGITEGLLSTWVQIQQLQTTRESYTRHGLFPWTGDYIRRKSAHLWYMNARSKQMEEELEQLNREIDQLEREKGQADRAIALQERELALLDREKDQADRAIALQERELALQGCELALLDREIAFHKEVDQIMEIVVAAASVVGKWPTDQSRISMDWQAAPMRSD